MSKWQRPLVTSLAGVSDEYMLNMHELAAILNVEQSKARELVATAKIPGGLHIGKLWRISAGAVRAWIASETLPKNAVVGRIRAAAKGAH